MAQVSIVENSLCKPQDILKQFSLIGVGEDGSSMRSFSLEDDLTGMYKVMFFFPLGMESDSSHVLEFSANLVHFLDLNCGVIGVTNESPLAVRRWMTKDKESGGFGKVVGFPILTDKDLSLSMSLGVARPCGFPARAMFILDGRNQVRFSMVHRIGAGKDVSEILRLVSAFQTSDYYGRAVPADWQPGSLDLIPTQYSKKVEYFKEKYGTLDTQSARSGVSNGSGEPDNLKSEPVEAEDNLKSEPVEAKVEIVPEPASDEKNAKRFLCF